MEDNSFESTPELAAEATAYKVMLDLVVAALCLQVSKHRIDPSVIPHSLALRIKEKRGELLTIGPPDLSPQIQAAASRRFRAVLDEVSRDVLSRMEAAQKL